MAIILRASKSVPLTFTEMDGNFSDLNSRTTTLEGAHIKNVNGVTANSSNAITIDTDDVGEGSTNQYFTNARARSAISITDAGGDGSLAYNSSTGVITYTGPSAAEVRAHISATSATGVTYTAGTGVIALASIPNSSITNSTITVAGDSGSTAIDLGDTLTVTGGSGLETSQSGDTLTIDVSANGINDTHIDFGTGANQVSTADIPEQTNLYYTDVRADARIAAANLTDLNDVSYSSPTTNHVLTWTGSGWEAAEAPGAAGGEVNRGVNVGGYNELFKEKAGVELRFRTIDHGDNLSITQGTDTLTINTVAAPEFGNIKIGGNTIENISTNSNIALVPNGTGVVTTDGDLLPASDSAYDLGAVGTEWANAYIDDITATNLTGTIQTGAQPNIVSIGAQTANINMNNNKIINVTDPTSAQDAATKAYVDTQLQTQDTLQEITDNGATTTNTITADGFTTDGLTVTDNNIQTTRSNDNIVMLPNGTGVVEMRSAVAMSTNKITGVGDPTSAQDAATKAYVDGALSSGTTIFTLQADSGSNDAVLTGDTIDFEGTANEIETAVSANKITIGLPSDVTITGNLTINGTTVTNNASNLIVDDALIELNHSLTGSNASDLGLVMERGTTGDNAFIGWDESADKFIVGTTTATGASSGDLTITSGTLVAATFEGNLTGDVTGDVTGNADTATAATTVTITAQNTGDTNCPLVFVLDGTEEDKSLYRDSSVYVDTTANVIYATGFDGDLTGNADTATEATNVTVTANNTANETVYITFVDGATGTQGIETDTNLSYNPSTNVLSTTASQAQYADLAEIYASDAEYVPDTVVMIGGTAEITAANSEAQYIAGVISTAPAYLMNSNADGQAVALVGRVPVLVVGAVNKGQAVFAAESGVASTNGQGPIVGIALESSSNTEEKLIECLLKV